MNNWTNVKMDKLMYIVNTYEHPPGWKDASLYGSIIYGWIDASRRILYIK